jgi:hypothetical protein
VEMKSSPSALKLQTRTKRHVYSSNLWDFWGQLQM